MSIKRVAQITFLALGTQPIMQAYDAIALKDQVAAIAKYAQELRNENNPKALQLATWLENKIADTSNTTDSDVAAIAMIATKYESKTGSQIAALSKKVNNILAYVLFTTLATVIGFGTMGAYMRFVAQKRTSGWT